MPYTFTTSSDTEVVLRGYLQWGDAVADRLNGMYAFAIWDSRDRKLVMIRDRMGIKPFYFYPTSDGVLFGSSNAHRDLRKLLVDENQLEAVISMPGGVFKPYAGVSTAILIFTKGGKTERVWFYKMESDGYSLDDKREKIGDGLGDLPDIREKWFARDKAKKGWPNSARGWRPCRRPVRSKPGHGTSPS